MISFNNDIRYKNNLFIDILNFYFSDEPNMDTKLVGYNILGDGIFKISISCPKSRPLIWFTKCLLKETH